MKNNKLLKICIVIFILITCCLLVHLLTLADETENNYLYSELYSNSCTSLSNFTNDCVVSYSGIASFDNDHINLMGNPWSVNVDVHSCPTIQKEKPFYLSFDFYFDETFSGIVFGCNNQTCDVIVHENGTFTLGSQTTEESVCQNGWNRLNLYFFYQNNSETHVYANITTTNYFTNGLSSEDFAHFIATGNTVYSSSILNEDLTCTTNKVFIRSLSNSMSNIKLNKVQLATLLQKETIYKVAFEDDSSIVLYAEPNAIMNIPKTLGEHVFVSNETVIFPGDSILVNENKTIKSLIVNAASVTLGSKFTLNLRVALSAFASSEHSINEIVLKDNCGNVYSGTYDSSTKMVYFRVSDLHITEYNDLRNYKVSILCDSKEYTALTGVDYSPISYAYNMYEKSTVPNSLKTVLVGMVQYVDAALKNKGEISTIYQDFCNQMNIQQVDLNTVSIQPPTINEGSLSGKISVGAVLGESISLLISADSSVQSMTINSTTTLSNTIVYDKINAGNLNTVLRITLVDQVSTYSGEYSAAHYLSELLNEYDDNTTQGHLTRAFIQYMNLVASYLNSLQ